MGGGVRWCCGWSPSDVWSLDVFPPSGTPVAAGLHAGGHVSPPHPRTPLTQLQSQPTPALSTPTLLFAESQKQLLFLLGALD